MDDERDVGEDTVDRGHAIMIAWQVCSGADDPGAMLKLRKNSDETAWDETFFDLSFWIRGRYLCSSVVKSITRSFFCPHRTSGS
jgi:hypothetical protein